MQERYKELGYKVHKQTDDYTIMLKKDGKVKSAIVLGPDGQTDRVLNGMQIDKLLKGEDIMAVKKKKVAKKRPHLRKRPL